MGVRSEHRLRLLRVDPRRDLPRSAASMKLPPRGAHILNAFPALNPKGRFEISTEGGMLRSCQPGVRVVTSPG
jgi:hypothetical protein